MSEPVRLVIWDLDETFWNGTLSEGGITWRDDTRAIVVELARRGIMSSICSKNDFESARSALADRGAWDYFIFPSIDWSPKGPRIQRLIETVQLRAQSVMLIDDNHLNLEEARFFSPGLQVAADTAIPTLLADPLFKGKEDRGLSRLKQYKVLEARKAGEIQAGADTGGDNIQFLKSSNIRVRIDIDVEAHLDRAIELINRTNQLNFIKRRLPEDREAARRALRTEIARFDTQAGLIEVSDDYGDYGYCGYYQVTTRRDVAQLNQFCFSCRVLGLGVEAWIYQRLGRPRLEVRGEVLSNPLAEAPVDWIRIHAGASTHDANAGVAGALLLGSVAARGGCMLWPLAHYFRFTSPSVIGEFNTIRDGKLIPLDHSLCLRHAISGLTKENLDVIAPLGYIAEDFETKYFNYSGDIPVWIFSNFVDAGRNVYRHNRTGFTIPCRIPRGAEENKAFAEILPYLKAEFSRYDYNEVEFKKTLHVVFSKIPRHGLMFVLLSPEQYSRPDPRMIERNRWRTEVASSYANVRCLAIADFVEEESEMPDANFTHYDRKVYYRLFQHIVIEANTHRVAEGGAGRREGEVGSSC